MHNILMVAGILLGGLAVPVIGHGTPISRQEALPVLKFTEVLDVVAIGVQLEKQHLLNRDPSLGPILRDAATSFETILKSSGFLEPELVFGKLQTDLGHHQGREYSIFIQSFMDIMNLYQEFFRLNADLYEAGVRTPFQAFLTAIHQGLREDASGNVMIAGDAGQVNPLNMIRSRELVFTSW